MTTPSPFEIARTGGANFAKALQPFRQSVRIDDILSQVSSSGNEADIDNAMSQIISRVTPENQKPALGLLQNQKNKILQGQRAQAFKGLELPEELAQLPDSVASAFINKKFKGEAGLSKFQELSVDLREKEQGRKVENAITSELVKLSENRVVQPVDIPFLSAKTADLISEGTQPVQAINQVVKNYRAERELINELKIPKYKPKKGVGEAVKAFKENNISTPNIIENKLREQNYPAKSRQDILKQVTGEGAKTAEKEAQATPGELPTLTQEQVESAIDSMEGPSRNEKVKQAEKLFQSLGYKVEL